jgi:hypothetical protein
MYTVIQLCFIDIHGLKKQFSMQYLNVVIGLIRNNASS